MYEDKPSIDILMHVGVGHLDGGHSGRYPWGSGEHKFQRASTFLSRIDELKSDRNFIFVDTKGLYGPKGKTYKGEAAIAHYMGLTDKQFRTQQTVAKDEERTLRYNRAKKLYDSGYGYTEIARKMGLKDESSARSILKDSAYRRNLRSHEVADLLKETLDAKLKEDPNAMLDIGNQVEREIGQKLGYRVSKEKLQEALFILQKDEGYKVDGGRMPYVTDPSGKHMITMSVLCGPDAKKGAVYNYGSIYTVEDYETSIEERNTKNFEYPASLSSKRLDICYKEDGGSLKDGVIELRRGVDDLSLGGKSYAQVRILVDGTHYLKGMAIYSDDLPKGIDVRFNTKKNSGTPLEDVLKKIKDDPDNPFGSNIKEKEGVIVGQHHYIDKNGVERLGVVNRTRDEGDWNEWRDDLSAQFLSKQPLQLAKRQLNQAIKEKQDEYNDILKCENPTLRKTLLNTFASECDSAAVHLKAAALPRQKFQVILPLGTLKDNEIYATNFQNGETVALIRYPHAGTFEIPILTVNNHNKEGIKTLGLNSEDCVGINAKTASQLSGADYDGDTVMVIPLSDKVKIKASPALKGLDNFDTDDYGPVKTIKDKSGKEHYFNAAGNEYKPMDESEKQKQMGVVSNLISDMTLKGANDAEKLRAAKHSMVVIDAVKHHLDYKSSEVENDIQELKDKYQGHYNEKGNWVHGASTLISKAKSEERIPKTQGSPKVNIKGTPWYDETKPEGSLITKTADNLYYVQVATKDANGKTVWVNAYDDKSTGKDKYNNQTIDIVSNKIKKGKYSYNVDDPNGEYKRKDGTRYSKVTIKNEKTRIIQKTDNSTKMAEATDARTLISDRNTLMEQAYATFANTMKAMANEARKVSWYTPATRQNKSAREAYAKERESLLSKLDISEKNAPRERTAHKIANARVNAKLESQPSIKDDKEQVKKLRQQELLRARNQVGAQRKTIDITDREWEAIQAGALSADSLSKIFAHTDGTKLKERAIPRESKTVTDSMIFRMQSLRDSGHTNAEIAQLMGISATSVSKYLSE